MIIILAPLSDPPGEWKLLVSSKARNILMLWHLVSSLSFKISNSMMIVYTIYPTYGTMICSIMALVSGADSDQEDLWVEE